MMKETVTEWSKFQNPRKPKFYLKLTYLKDIKDFIKKLNEIQKVPEDNLLAT